MNSENIAAPATRWQAPLELAAPAELQLRFQNLPHTEDLSPVEKFEAVIMLWERAAADADAAGVFDGEDEPEPDQADTFAESGRCQACMEVESLNELGYCASCWKELTHETKEAC